MKQDNTIDYINYVGLKEPGSDLSKVRNAQNVRKTRSLFIEMCKSKGNWNDAVYTMRPDSFQNLPSAYQIYMNSVDEYDAAMKLVGCLDHWRKLLDCEVFVEGYTDPMSGQFFPGLKQWRMDKAQQLHSRGLRALMSKADKGDTNAAKALLAESKEMLKSLDKKVIYKKGRRTAEEKEEQGVWEGKIAKFQAKR